jgi:hypothetical protein
MSKVDSGATVLASSDEAEALGKFCSIKRLRQSVDLIVVAPLGKSQDLVAEIVQPWRSSRE